MKLARAMKLEETRKLLESYGAKAKSSDRQARGRREKEGEGVRG